MTSRSLTAGLLASALVMVACSEEVAPPVYQLVPVVRRDIVLSARAEGVIEPVQTVEIKSKASGEIMEVLAEPADVVRRGALLVRVDPRVARNAVAQAEADSLAAQAELETSESKLARSEALFASGSISEQELEQARLDRATAYAALVRAQRTLQDARIGFEDTEVRAPADGVILTRAVEVGTVIASANRAVSGGAVLMTMANLDTVQLRTLVVESDIGKVQPGQPVTITVDAYPNRSFSGSVLKIEPLSVTEQNQTKYPVLVRIPNPDGTLRPGMNADIEIHIGNREGVLAIANAALRTERDVESAATVIGIDPVVVRRQLAGAGSGGAAPETPADAAGTITIGGRVIELPPGVDREQVQAVLNRMRNGGFQALSAADRALLGRIRPRGGGEGGGRGRSGRRQARSDYQFGGNYVVFAMRAGVPTAVRIRTGLTDLDYSEVVEGLSAADTVLLLPSASLVQSQQALQERIARFTGGLPGVRR